MRVCWRTQVVQTWRNKKSKTRKNLIISFLQVNRFGAENFWENANINDIKQKKKKTPESFGRHRQVVQNAWFYQCILLRADFINARVSGRPHFPCFLFASGHAAPQGVRVFSRCGDVYATTCFGPAAWAAGGEISLDILQNLYAWGTQNTTDRRLQRISKKHVCVSCFWNILLILSI